MTDLSGPPARLLSDVAERVRQADALRRPVYAVLGVPIDALDMAQAIAQIRRSVRDRLPCFLSTPNTNFVVAAQRDAGFRLSLQHSDLVVPDGMPVVWLARLLRLPMAQRISGSDIFDELLLRPGPPVRVYFFGGPDGVAEAAAQRVNARGGALSCVGFQSPGYKSIQELSAPAHIDPINASGADFVIVSLGAAKGQHWIERNRQRLQAPVLSHFGAVVNFIAGKVRRAPPWMRSVGLEWLWRIREEPQLWRRYGHDAWQLLRLLLRTGFSDMRRIRRMHDQPPAEAPRLQRLRCTDRSATVRLEGCWTAHHVQGLIDELCEHVLQQRHVELDIAAVSWFDPRVLGVLLLAQTRLMSLVLVGASSELRRALRRQAADHLLEGLAGQQQAS